MRPIDKYIFHVVNNLFPLNEYSEGEVKRLVKHYQEEADEKNIEIDEKLLIKYIQQFDKLKNSNHPDIKDREIRHWPLQKLIRLAAKYAGQDEEDWDPGLEVVYEEGPISIWNGSEEDRCIKYARNESPWCIGRGSFMNYRGDANKGNPVFYLCRNRSLDDDNKLSFVAVQVRNPEVKRESEQYVYTNRKNSPYESNAMSWEQLMREIPWLSTVPNVKSLLKYIPLSPQQKQGTALRQAMPIKKWLDLPLNFKKQFLINRKSASQFLEDIDNKTFLTKYVSKIPSLMDFVATNAGTFQPLDILGVFSELDKQSQKSVLANLHDKFNMRYLFTDELPFLVKQLITHKNLWETGNNNSVYLADNDKAIVKVSIGDSSNVELGFVTEDEEHPRVKLTKNTAKYLVNCPFFAEDSSRVWDYESISKMYGLNKELDTKLDAALEKVTEISGTDFDNEKVEKDGVTYYIDHKTHSAFKKDANSLTQIPFEDLETVLGGEHKEKTAKGIIKKVIDFFEGRSNLPASLKKETVYKVIEDTPYNDRNGPSGVVLLAKEDDTIFLVNTKVALTSMLSFGGEGRDWNRIARGVAMSKPMWEAYFAYRRPLGLSYSRNDVFQMFKKVDGSNTYSQALRNWFDANPPLDTEGNFKVVMHENELYLLDLQTPSESAKISSRSNKAVKAALSGVAFNRLAGIQAPVRGQRPQAAAAPAPAAAQPAPETPAEPGAAPALVRDTMRRAGLEAQFNNLPAALRTRINALEGVSSPNDRGIASRNTLARERGGSVAATIRIQRDPANVNDKTTIWFIRIGEGYIADIKSYPCSPGLEYIVTPSRVHTFHSQQAVAEFIRTGELNEEEDVIKNLISETVMQQMDELNFKKALTGAALAATLATGSPAKAQNFQGLKDKFKAGVTAVQNKIHPQQKADTVKVQKDTPLQLAKFKDFKGAGYGYAKSQNPSIAQKQALINAKADLMKKMNIQRIEAGFEEKAMKTYQNPDGSYEVEILVVLGDN